MYNAYEPPPVTAGAILHRSAETCATPAIRLSLPKRAVQTAASALLLLLTLFFGVAAGTPDLAAQTAPTGTWFFTGVTGDVSGNDSTSSGLLKGKLTVSSVGSDAYTISYDWATGTDRLMLAPPFTAKAPDGVFTTVLHNISVADGTQIRAKFVKVDNDTWLFYLAKTSVASASTQLNGHGIVGVLTRSALPAVNAANWEKTFALSGVSWDQWSSGAYESYFGASSAVMQLYKNGNRYYTHFNGTGQSTWERGYEYDEDSTLVSSYVSNSQINYEYEPSGDLINHYSIYEGNFTYTYNTDGTLFEYSQKDGDTEYYYDVDGTLTGYEKYENDSWNYYSADGTLYDSYPDDYYTAESDYLHTSEEDGDGYIIQLSGNRLAEIYANFSWGIELDVFITGNPSTPTDSTPYQPALPTLPAFTTNLAATTTPNSSGAATLSVVVTGNPTPVLQWQTRANASAEWVNISGGNTAALALSGLIYAHNGAQYRVAATNTKGTVYSNATTITGIPLPPSAPAFTVDLPDTTPAPASAATLSVATAGNPLPTLQWQRSTDGGANWTNVAGATSSTLALSGLTYLNNGDQYRVAATNVADTTYSSTTTLVDIPGAPVPPEFTADLPATTSAATGSATLTVTATGTPVLTYQWQKSTNGGASWANVSGATTASLALRNLVYADNGTLYRVVVENGVGSLVSNSTALVDIPAVPPKVVGTPVVTGADKLAIHKNALQTAMDAIRGIPSPDYEIAAGSNVSYAVSAIGEGLSYQWRKDGNDIPGATGAAYTAPDIQAADGHSVVVTNVDGGSVEAAAPTPSFVPYPEIVTQPAANTALIAGRTATLSVTARGGSQFYYQWYRYNPVTGRSEAIPFAILPTFTVSDEGSYYVVVNNRANVPVSSELAQVVVGRAAPVFTIDLLPGTLVVNGTISLTVAATGLPAPVLQWQTRANANGEWTTIPGATATTLTRTGLTAADNDSQYRAVAINSEGTAYSVATTLSGIPVPVVPGVTGIVNGTIRDALTNVALGAATLSFYNEAGNSVGTTVSNASGNYAQVLPSGRIRVDVSRAGYTSAQLYVNVPENATIEADVVFLAPAGVGNGTISGHLINAFTGSGVSGVTLRLRSGANVTTGQVLQTLNAGSTYTLTVPGGNYTLEASATGYVTSYVNVVSVGGNTVGNQDVTLTPQLATTGEIRIVLTWGSTPGDLDSHLSGPSSSGGTFHVYYGANNPSGASANLDVDDTSSYGPETITISQLRTGTYTYWVHNFSGGGNGVLSASGAKVVVYRATGGTTVKVAEYNVPSNGSGLDWEVFQINGSTGVITPINRVYTK